MNIASFFRRCKEQSASAFTVSSCPLLEHHKKYSHYVLFTTTTTIIMGAPPSLEAENNNKDDDDDNSWINHDNKHAHLKHATTSHDDNNNNSSLSIYLSLVTQYLAVFMIDNAIFLAERCVADHPSSADACYLLALCYYRQGSYKRAQGLLSSSGTTTSTTTTSHPNAAMRYLAAQIALQLKDYTRAEQVLLKECRRNYQLAVRESATNTTTETKTTAFPSIDEWIVQTTVRSEKIYECMHGCMALLVEKRILTISLSLLLSFRFRSPVLFPTVLLVWHYWLPFVANPIATSGPFNTTKCRYSWIPFCGRAFKHYRNWEWSVTVSKSLEWRP
jgi:hypothetical protein